MSVAKAGYSNLPTVPVLGCHSFDLLPRKCQPGTESFMQITQLLFSGTITSSRRSESSIYPSKRHDPRRRLTPGLRTSTDVWSRLEWFLTLIFFSLILYCLFTFRERNAERYAIHDATSSHLRLVHCSFGSFSR